jgi:hypothetical protein
MESIAKEQKKHKKLSTTGFPYHWKDELSIKKLISEKKNT